MTLSCAQYTIRLLSFVEYVSGLGFADKYFTFQCNGRSVLVVKMLREWDDIKQNVSVTEWQP